MEERRFMQGLGEYIRALFVGLDVLKGHLPERNPLTNVMVSYVNVFRSSMVLGVGRNFNGCLIVIVYENGSAHPQS